MTTTLLGIQIVGVLFGLMMIYVSFMHNKRNEFTSKETFFWMLIWTTFIFVTLVPRSLDFIAKGVLNMGRTMDFLIISGFIMTTGLLYYIYGLTRSTQRKLEEVVRKTALREARKK